MPLGPWRSLVTLLLVTFLSFDNHPTTASLGRLGRQRKYLVLILHPPPFISPEAAV